jgi:archaeal type IV pilus assembly protein PilA
MKSFTIRCIFLRKSIYIMNIQRKSIHCHAHREHCKRCNETMVTRKNDEAVSPVIGVILMVAITVILAAVIAAFVFGMSGNITKTKIVAVTAQQPDAKTITVTYQGGQDAGSFSKGNVTVIPGNTSSCGMGYTPSSQELSPEVGSTVIVKGTGCFDGKDHVVATGTFGDGSVQVLLDTYI